MKLSKAQIEHMVSRFLSWRLPENFNPDCGISFKAEYNENTLYPAKHQPTGTNLFDYQQAEAMIRHIAEGLPCAAGEGEWVSVASGKMPALGKQILFYVASDGGWIESGYLRDAAGERDDYWECERTAPQDEPIRFSVRDERVTHWRELPKPPAPPTPQAQPQEEASK